MPNKKLITEEDIQVGKNIGTIRRIKGLSRNDLGEKIGITHQQISKYEEGINRVSVGMLIKISRVLKTHIMDFFTGIGKDLECTRVDANIIKLLNQLHPHERKLVLRLIKVTLSNRKKS